MSPTQAPGTTRSGDPLMTAHAHAALEQLTDLLGNRLLTDPESAQRYGVDWTKVWAPAPSAIALPETIDEVQQIVEIANDHGLHLVPPLPCSPV